MSGIPTPEELLAQAQAGTTHSKEGEPQELFYEPEDPVCVLTLDQKQAWVLFLLLAPYRKVDHSYWDVYRAAWDVRRRLAEALGYEQEG